MLLRCDREFSHRGMCNKKAKILGTAAWDPIEVVQTEPPCPQGSEAGASDQSASSSKVVCCGAADCRHVLLLCLHPNNGITCAQSEQSSGLADLSCACDAALPACVKAVPCMAPAFQADVIVCAEVEVQIPHAALAGQFSAAFGQAADDSDQGTPDHWQAVQPDILRTCNHVLAQRRVSDLSEQHAHLACLLTYCKADQQPHLHLLCRLLAAN